MSTPAAPAASGGATSTPANGAPSNGAAAPSSRPAPAPAAPKPSPRAQNGQFSPKDGAVGVVAEEAKPKDAPAEETPAEVKRRMKLKLKVRGAEEDWEGTEEDVQRELQVGRARAREAAELRQKLQERESEEGLLKSNLDEYLRKRGVDPEEFVRTRLQQMVEHERLQQEDPSMLKALEAERARDEALAKLKDREEKDKKMATELRTKQLRQKRMETYAAALKATGLPLETDAEKREMIYRMAQTEALVRDEEGRHDFTPQELAQETLRRAKGDGKFYLDSLSIPALVAELGPQRVQALLEHTVAEFEKASGQPSAQHQEAAPAQDEDAPREFIDEREAERRLRDMTRAAPRRR